MLLFAIFIAIEVADILLRGDEYGVEHAGAGETARGELLKADAERQHRNQGCDADGDADRGEAVAQLGLAKVADGEIEQIVALHARASSCTGSSKPRSCRRFRSAFGNQLAVGEEDKPLREALGQSTLVRDHDDGHAQREAHVANEVEDVFAGAAVEVAGRLVGQQYRRAIGERAGQRNTLLLAARELRRTMVETLAQADALQRFADALRALGAIDFGEAHRQLNVLRDGHRRDEMEGLEDHADIVAAIAREVLGRHLREIAPLHDDRAGSWSIETGEQVEQRRFAGSGLAEKRDELAATDGQRDSVNGADDAVAHGVVAADVVGAHSFGGVHWYSIRC